MNNKTYQNQKNFNPHLQINCSMDMDALEITKTYAIKKYEENIYLLGNIFDLSDNRIIENDEENLLEKNFQNYNKINNTKNNNNNLSEENEEEDTLNEVIDFFDKNKEDDNEDMDQDEKMDRLLRDIRKKDEKNNGINQKLIEQLNDAYESYKDTKDLLIKKENKFKEHNREFENLMSKMKGYKGFYDEKFFNEIIEKSKSLGLITETFNQLESYEKNPDNLNKDCPFNGNDKPILYANL
jgi:hypothetical protein